MPPNAGRLTVTLEGNVVQTVPLTADVLTVGRGPENGLVLADNRVSRQHAEFRRGPEGLSVVDLDSHNGILIDGKPLPPRQPYPVPAGAALQVGPFTLTYEPSEAPSRGATDVEPVFPQLRIMDESGRTQSVEMLNVGALTIGRGDDCDLLLDSDYVSRDHVRVEWSGATVTATDLDSKNGTWIEDRRLPARAVQPWEWDQSLRVGRFTIKLERERPTPRIGVLVDQAALTITPGQSVDITVTLANLGTTVDHLTITVEGRGVRDTWWKGPREAVQLNPGARVAVPITIAVPRAPESRAGEYVVRVRARSRENPAESGLAQGRWTVLPYAETVVELEPARVAGRLRGSFRVGLRNGGNAPARYTLSAVDDEQTLRYAFQPGSVALQPGKSAQIGLRVRARPRLSGSPQQRGFKVRSLAEGGEAPQLAAAQFVHQALVPQWMVPLLAPVLVLGALVGLAYAFGRPPEVKDFKAEPAAVIAGTPVALSWSLERASSVTIEPSSGSEQLAAPQGKLAVAPTASTRYTLTARNVLGIQASRSVNVEVRAPLQAPRIVSYSASVERVKKEGEAVTLRWETEGATKVTIEPADEIKDPPLSGEATVHPTKTNAVYRLVATNAAGSKEATKTIVIEPPQIGSFSATPDAVFPGGEVRLRWQAQNFTKLTIKASRGEIVQGKQEVEVPASATEQVVRPIQEAEYVLVASNAGGADSKTVKVSVSPMQIVLFKAEPSAIAKGAQSQLSWKVDGATTVVIQPDVGAVAPGETSRLVSPGQTTEYTLTATAADGSKQEKKAAVTVGPGQVKVDVFTAAPPSVTKGEQAILNFGVQNAAKVTIMDSDNRQVYARDVPPGQATLVGNVRVSPEKTTIYTLTASNESGQALASATVVFQQPTPTPPPSPAPPKP